MRREVDEVRDRLAGVCTVALHEVPADGALITLSTPQGAQAVQHATDELFRRLDDAQTTAGEGPAVDAFAAGLPVLADDLGTSDAGRRWPAFAPAARDAGVKALFALPMRIGVIRLGVFSLYRFARGGLADAELATALRLADTAGYALLGMVDSLGTDGVPESRAARLDGGLDGAADELYRATVHQASGMIMVQLGVSIDEALARMRAYGYAEELPLSEVARAIVARSLRLER
jgi:hypothetical protein